MASASFRSVAELFLHRVASTPDAEAFTFPVEGGWRTLTWEQTGERVQALAAGLLALGLRPEERVAILSSTRVEWILADLAVLCAGLATTTLHPQAPDAEVEHILRDSESRVLITENAEQSARVEPLRARLPHLRRVVQIEPGGDASHDFDAAPSGPFVMTMSALDEGGRARLKGQPTCVRERAMAVPPEQLATLMYTSGTTGRPKGVEICHSAWVFEGEAMDALGMLSPADRQLLFLPLAHSFAKVLELAGIRIGISTVVDGRPEELVRTMAATRPTFVAAVPRVLEKLKERVEARAERRGAPGRFLMARALKLGAAVDERRQQGGRPGPLLQARQALVDRLVFARFREALGGRLRFFLSGAAPLPPGLGEFFQAAGVTILEGYGLTESCAASFVNRPERFKLGTVGQPLPGVEVRLDPADGEILLRSPGNMRGYHGLPEETALALSPDGWLRTGDIGALDEEGFLRITDRKGELFKTSSGRFVSPLPIERALRAASPLIGEALVHGPGRPHVVALLALSEQAAGRIGRPEVEAAVQEAVDRVNQTLAPHEQIRSFALLPRPLGEGSEERAVPDKRRRRVLERSHAELLEELYRPEPAEP